MTEKRQIYECKIGAFPPLPHSCYYEKFLLNFIMIEDRKVVSQKNHLKYIYLVHQCHQLPQGEGINLVYFIFFYVPLCICVLVCRGVLSEAGEDAGCPRNRGGWEIPDMGAGN